jgi:ABC-type amino acid transport substrate-binding protein
VSHTIPEKYYKDAEYSIVLRKGSPILEQVNEVLKNLNTDGTLAAIKQKWIKQ